MTLEQLLAEVAAMQARGLPVEAADNLRMAILYREDKDFRAAVNSIVLD